MARPIPSMEMFSVGAHLSLIEGCDSIAYYLDLADPKQFWVDVCGTNRKTNTVYYVDLLSKFSGLPENMRPATIAKRFYQRYTHLQEACAKLWAERPRVRFLVWSFTNPAARVHDPLRHAAERLRAQAGIELEISEREQIVRHLAAVTERAKSLDFDLDNLFIRAVHLASGKLDYQQGAPISGEEIQAMYTFPLTIQQGLMLPQFVHQFLCSDFVVNWLDFEVPSFQDLALTVEEPGDSEELGDLWDVLSDLTEVPEDPDAFFYEYEESPRFSAARIRDTLELIFENVDSLRELMRQAGQELMIDVDFLLPYLSKAQALHPSQIEQAVLRYGGDRDQMYDHFRCPKPERRCYRGSLCIRFHDPDGPPAKAEFGKRVVMHVPVQDAALTAQAAVSLSICYVRDFAGYFVLSLHHLADELSKECG